MTKSKQNKSQSSIKNQSSLKIYAKTMPVNVLGVILDIVIMYIIGHYTNLSINYQVYISSIARLCISFYGYFYITFKSNKSKHKTMIKFSIWELISLTVVSEITILVNKIIVNKIHKLDVKDNKNSKKFKDKIIKLFLQEKDGKYELKTYLTILLKHIIIMIFNLLFEIPVYKYIF